MTQKTLLRWTALFTVLLNILLNYYSNINPLNGKTIGEVSNGYDSLFTPAGYAFSIWGLIYLSFMIYVVVQLLPSQKSKEVYDHLSIPLILTSLLSIAWVVVFSFELLAWSVIIIFAMLVTALVLFMRSRKWARNHHSDKLVTVPFGLYAGWLTVASMAATSLWLYSLGWRGGALGEPAWAVVLLIVALIAGIIVSWKLENIVYSLVIIWATIAIWFARKEDYIMIANTALFVAGLLVLWSIVYGLKLYRKYF
jgi:hypothetical protein